MKNINQKFGVQLKNKICGFGMVEMLIGASMVSVSLFAISSFFQTVMKASATTGSAIQADYLLEEGVEVAKIFRDTSYKDNFLKMTINTPYYFLWDGTKWASSTVNTYIDGKFERTLIIDDVQRDSNSDITVSGTNDPDIKKVTVSVSWGGPLGTTTHSIQTYVTNIFNN